MGQLKRIINQANERESLITSLKKQLDEAFLLLATLVHKHGGEMSLNYSELQSMPDLRFTVEQNLDVITLKLVDKEEKPVEI